MANVLSLVIPVYNEGSNFPLLWASLSAQLAFEFSAYVIYDFEEDDTLPAIAKIVDNGEMRIRTLRNRHGRGVVGALRTGFDAVDAGPILVVMADLSDDLRQIHKMLDLYDQGFHVVVGSRYMKGGGIEGGPFLKQLLSRFAGVTLYWLRGIPTHDATNAFKIYDGAMLKTMRIESTQGFEINLELTVKAFLGGYRIAELPAVWKDRQRGSSRFRLWKWLPHYLKWYFYAFRRRHLQRFRE